MSDAEAAFRRYEEVRPRLPAASYPAASLHLPTLAEAADRWDGFVLDAFGVLNVGETAIPGAVLAGSQDGGVRAYSSTSGSLIWQFDTNREFASVNGVAAKGASIHGPGPFVAGGMVFVGSGYGSLGGRPGNVLLAFGMEP